MDALHNGHSAGEDQGMRERHSVTYKLEHLSGRALDAEVSWEPEGVQGFAR